MGIEFGNHAIVVEQRVVDVDEHHHIMLGVIRAFVSRTIVHRTIIPPSFNPGDDRLLRLMAVRQLLCRCRPRPWTAAWPCRRLPYGLTLEGNYPAFDWLEDRTLPTLARRRCTGLTGARKLRALRP